MNFIKKIVDGDIDEGVHLQFQKFSKGEFRNRAIIRAKNSKGKYVISTTAEFANEMVKVTAEKLGKNIAEVSGAIISTNDLAGKLDFQGKKQFMGIKQYVIIKKMSGNEIIALLKEFPKAFFALTFSSEKDNTSLKIKAKAPKSAKPNNKKDEKIKPDFCKFSTIDQEIGKSFVFESPNFKDAAITHAFMIEEIIVPVELKNSKDFNLIREKSKRKGKIIRESEIDGKRTINEIPFEA